MHRVMLAALLLVVLPGCDRSESSAQRSAPTPRSKAAPAVVLASVSLPPIPEGPPFVGDEGVDAHGYPLRRPDSTVLFALLKLGRYQDLDAAIDHYQDEFEADYRKESWPKLALETFSIPHAEVGVLLDAWASASPNSFGAQAARGVWHKAMGWKARGGGFVAKTSQSQLEALGKAHAQARAHFAAALGTRPKAVAVLQWQLEIARTRGDKQAVARNLASATKTCPACFDIRFAHVLAKGPLWRGSEAAMDRAASDAPVQTHPKLGVLAGVSAFDRCRALRRAKKPVEALDACAEAEAAGIHPRFSCTRASILVNEERYLEALAAVEPGLKHDAQNYDCLHVRELARRATGDYEGAADELLTLRRLNPYDPDLTPIVDWMMKQLRYEALQAAKAGDQPKQRRLRALADAIVPGPDRPHPRAVFPNERSRDYKRRSPSPQPTSNSIDGSTKPSLRTDGSRTSSRCGTPSSLRTRGTRGRSKSGRAPSGTAGTDKAPWRTLTRPARLARRSLAAWPRRCAAPVADRSAELARADHRESPARPQHRASPRTAPGGVRARRP